MTGMQIGSDIDIRPVVKALFVVRRWPWWGIEAKRKWARKLASACRFTADSCDDFINRTDPDIPPGAY